MRYRICRLTLNAYKTVSSEPILPQQLSMESPILPLSKAGLNRLIGRKMSKMSKTSERVSDLLRARVDKNKAAETVGVSIRTVERVRVKLDNGEAVSRKPGSIWSSIWSRPAVPSDLAWRPSSRLRDPTSKNKIASQYAIML